MSERARTPVTSARVRTPTLLQMEAVECGAVALGIVLAHFGRWMPLEELRVRCGVSRDGSRASHVATAAAQYGTTVQPFRMEPADLATTAMPVIAHWGMNHFVVIEGFSGGTVFLNDPATGPRQITMAELDRHFTGVVLTLTPGPDFARGGTPPRSLSGILSRLSDNLPSFTFIVGTSVVLIIPALLSAAFSQIFVDDILVSRFDTSLEPLLWAMAGTAVAMSVLYWIQLNALPRLETRLSVSGPARFWNT